MVTAAVEILRGIKDNDREAFDQALHKYTQAMAKINSVLSTTLKSTSEYASFRTFLSGCKDQPMFNNGVIYEGCLDSSPRQYFGVAQSSSPIASLNTHLFQLSKLSPRGTLPCSNNGIDNLRPESYQTFLSMVNSESQLLGVHKYALGSASSSATYIAALDQVLAYRYRQWANLRDSIPVQTSNKASFREYFDVQTRHIRDIAELIQRTLANTDAELLVPAQRAAADAMAHRAEMIRRSLNRILVDPETTPLPSSMIAY
ncbi:hypothetical protein GGI12_005623 [Dipsacomyces acuminosporus]|nr:hypothetical protein GGI12_005623 [Dipsacomyces acuminosporus]